MPQIMTTCPVTKQPVATGFNFDERSFRDPSNTFTNCSFACPACGRKHVWEKKDAYLEGEQPPADG